jgi:hypothetical protein
MPDLSDPFNTLVWGLLKRLLPMIALLGGLAVLFEVLKALPGMLSRRAERRRTQDWGFGPPGLTTDRPLTPSEVTFHRYLSSSCPLRDRYLVLAQVPLSKLLKKEGRLDRALYDMYSGGHVDFLLLNPVSGDPFLAIELDDSTHDTPAGAERSDRKNQLLALAGLPLVRTRIGREWAQEVLPEIQEALKPRT